MTNHIINVKPANLFISPFGFVSYSEDFYKACCSHFSTRPFSPAEFYLIGRSIELSLKAFLLLKGITRAQLKKRSLGHDLHKILKKCKELGLLNIVSVSEQQETAISMLNEWYARKGLEYFEIKNIVAGSGSLPNIDIVKELASELIEGLKQPCKDAANEP